MSQSTVLTNRHNRPVDGVAPTARPRTERQHRARHDLPPARTSKEVTAMSVLVPDQYRQLDPAGVARPGETDWIDTEIPCRVNDAELWFAQTPDGVARAQQLCAECPLQVACLAGALERHEPWGVWGGELFEHGVPVARKRRPGRPRKDDGLARQAAEQALAERLADVDLDVDVLTHGSDPRDDRGAAA